MRKKLRKGKEPGQLSQKRNLPIFCAFFVITALFFMVSGYAEKPKKAEKLNIAFQQWIGYGPFYLAKEKGFFAEEGIELNFIDEQVDSARRDAFKAGMLDLEAGTIDLLVSKRAQDIPVVAVMELDRSFGGDAVVAAKEIGALEDLKGKKVALTRDDVNETFLSYIFSKKGLNFKDIIIISCNPEDVARAFINKEADAAVTWEPWVSEALKREGAYILATTKDEPGIIVDTLNVREDLIKSKPELIKGTMRAWFKAVKYYEDNPEEAASIIAKYFKISPEDYMRQVEGLRWSSYKGELELEKKGAWHEAFDIIAGIKFDNARIGQKPDAKAAINTGLIESIYENSP